MIGRGDARCNLVGGVDYIKSALTFSMAIRNIKMDLGHQ
jgi:hypothetical protein